MEGCAERERGREGGEGSPLSLLNTSLSSSSNGGM